MSFAIATIIMFFAGLVGGIVSFHLPSNTEPDTTSDTIPPKMIKTRTWLQCVLLGIGATLLVPLFLEIAQSKILDGMHTGYQWVSAGKTSEPPADTNPIADTTGTGVPVIADTTKADTTKRSRQADTAKANKPSKASAKKTNTATTAPETSENPEPLKNYLLWSAYCFLAAAAGVRFINNIMDSVLKDKQIAKLKDENAEKEQEKKEAEEEKKKAEKEKAVAESQKEEAEKIKLKYAMNNRLSAKEQEQEIVPKILNKGLSVLPVIKPVTVLDDPQKGRFGGSPISNGRQLKAEVKPAKIPSFYNVRIWVESLDLNNPLTDEVVFYIHDSFNPSVYPIKPDEFTPDGKAMDDEIVSFGAFTVGAVADQGRTLLELDLAEQPEFPKQFRER